MKKIFINPLNTYLFIFVLATSLVVGISKIKYGYTEDFIENIFVEAHGMLFDILVIGILVYWLNSFGEKQRLISRYNEEIDDFRFWNSEESKYRVFGIIKRLIKVGYKEIDFTNLDFENLKLDGVFQKAIIRQTNFKNCDLSETCFLNSNFYQFEFEKILLSKSIINSRFLQSDLSSLEFENIDLTGTEFIGVNLSKATFTNCKLNNVQFKECVISYTVFKSCEIHNTKMYVNKLCVNNSILDSDVRKLDVIGFEYMYDLQEFLNVHMNEFRKNYLDEAKVYTSSGIRFKRISSKN